MDKSQIPRNSVEEYLSSDDYKIIIKDKLSVNGLSHKDRKLSSEYRGMISTDDFDYKINEDGIRITLKTHCIESPISICNESKMAITFRINLSKNMY